MFEQYPIEILREIFTYDDTYIEYFKTHVLKELSIHFFLSDRNKPEIEKKYVLEVKDSKIGNHWLYIAQYYESNDDYYLLDISGYRFTYHIWRTKEQLQDLDYVKIWNEDLMFKPNGTIINIPKMIRYRYFIQVLWLMDDDFDNDWSLNEATNHSNELNENITNQSVENDSEQIYSTELFTNILE